MGTAKNKYLVTAALPYANGRLHVGHIAGAYLPADEFVRYSRLVGNETHFVCGSDENGAPITFMALKEKVSPQEIIDRYHPQFERDFAGLDIEFSWYGRTHCDRHVEISQEFFTKLHAAGHVQKRSSEQVYCTACEMFLPDRYIEGGCYHDGCEAENARGDQCEKCGRQIDATKLVDPKCQVCRLRGRDSGAIEVRAVDHWYFRLDSFEADLRVYLAAHPEWRESVKRFSNGLLEEGLRERPVTRDLPWGIPVPLEAGAGKVLFVWFDAPIGYITFTRQMFEARGEPEKWREFWQNDETGLVHFIGKDNTVFHALFFPGMLLAHGKYRLPDAVVANEFLNLERNKISTSRNYAVWVDEYLAAFSADSLRYYLTAIAPETSDSTFSWQDFQARNNGELADNLGNFIQRNLAFCKKYFASKVPGAEEFSPAGQAMLEEIELARKEVGEYLATYSFRSALDRVMRLSQKGNQFFAEDTPWKTRKTDMAACGATIQVGLRVVEALSVLMQPFMPGSALKLRGMLNLTPLEDGDWERAWMLIPGRSIGEPEILFPKIEDSEIEKQLAALTK